MTREDRHRKLNEEKWNKRAAAFDEKRFDYFRVMQKRLVDALGLQEGQKLLDLGCGTGWAVSYAGSLVNDRGVFYGIDISPRMIERAKAKYSERASLHFIHTSADELPFGSAIFDFVICSNSFHHYQDPESVLRNVRSVLKEQGRFYMLDFTADGFLARLWDRWTAKREKEHVRFYSSAEYRVLFRRAGLKYVSRLLAGWGMIGFPMRIHVGERAAD